MFDQLKEEVLKKNKIEQISGTLNEKSFKKIKRLKSLKKQRCI